jgi:hypothetical protein
VFTEEPTMEVRFGLDGAEGVLRLELMALVWGLRDVTLRGD